MSYREPASPELREETARRRRMEDEDRARRAADIDSDDSFEPPFERTFGDGGRLLGTGRHGPGRRRAHHTNAEAPLQRRDPK